MSSSQILRTCGITRPTIEKPAVRWTTHAVLLASLAVVVPGCRPDDATNTHRPVSASVEQPRNEMVRWLKSIIDRAPNNESASFHIVSFANRKTDRQLSLMVALADIASRLRMDGDDILSLLSYVDEPSHTSASFGLGRQISIDDYDYARLRDVLERCIGFNGLGDGSIDFSYLPTLNREGTVLSVYSFTEQ